MTKRKGYVIERIASIENLREADKEAQSGKVKSNRYIRRHNMHQEEDLKALREMILTLSFPNPDFTTMTVISDSGKKREIVKQRYFPWRILHHAIMRVIGPDLYNSLINDSFACVKGKGLHFGVKRMKMFLRRYPYYKWMWKTDYKKYYQSIPHDIIINSMRRKYKDERFIRLVEVAILSYNSEIDNILNDEKKKRDSNRLIYQPADR